MNKGDKIQIDETLQLQAGQAVERAAASMAAYTNIPTIEEVRNMTPIEKAAQEASKTKHPQSIDDAFDNTQPFVSEQEFADLAAKSADGRPVVVGMKDTPRPGGELGAELLAWWMDLAAEEAEEVIAKALEYGGDGRADDLIDIGRDLHRSGIKLPGGEFYDGEEDGQYIELAIFFYIDGKIGRWKVAIREGRPVSDDTLKDIGVYVRMLQRVRAVGGWPV